MLFADFRHDNNLCNRQLDEDEEEGGWMMRMEEQEREGEGKKGEEEEEEGKTSNIQLTRKSENNFCPHNKEYSSPQNVVKNMQTDCRCHGTSGSCSMKTCFRRTPTMRHIGNVLKGLYDTAVKVIQGAILFFLLFLLFFLLILLFLIFPDNSIHGNALRSQAQQASFAVRGNPRSNSIESPKPRARQYPAFTRPRPRPRSNRKRQRTRNRSRKMPALLRADTIHGSHPQRTALVYYEEVPPDFYCDRRPEWNILGVSQRSCNSTSTARDNCKRLCCSRGYFTRHRQVREQCRCKFVWCCRVDCETCIVDRRYETCS